LSDLGTMPPGAWGASGIGLNSHPAGAYTVVVTSPDNAGKSVLAVGKIEKFPPKEMARTIVALPKLK